MMPIRCRGFPVGECCTFARYLSPIALFPAPFFR